jgi:nucleoredoxin
MRPPSAPKATAPGATNAKPASAALAALFGDTLLTQAGERPTQEVLAGKTAVGIYFSAHWCPPCRGFTPKLAQSYTKAFKAKGMEIVFVSSDRDEGGFKEYFGEQPWVAVPFAKREVKEALSKKYKVSGIPGLVIVDAEGETITKDGREAVSSDPAGEKYPWKPPSPAEKKKTVLDTLGKDLLHKAAGKPIGLYFSAHWCPPCRGFTPKLSEFYKNGLKDKMEIIFVSSDRDEDGFNEYAAEMPWLALPFAKRREKETLSKAFGVSGIPALIVINSDGSVITEDGRGKVMKDPKGQNFPEGWLPKPFNDVNDDPSDLNEEQCLIALGSAREISTAVEAVASEYFAKAGSDVSAMPMRFFSGPDGNVSDQLRKLTGLKGDKLLLLDIPSGGAFYVCEQQKVNSSAVKEFIAGVAAGKIKRNQLS